MSAVRFLIIIVIVSLQACVSPPPPSGETAEQFIAACRYAARQLEQQDHLAAALDQWRIVLTLAPNDPEATQAITTLNDQVKSRVDQLFARGRSRYNSGDLRRAELNFLSVLALHPTHSEAFTYLQKITSAHMRAAQRNKTATETKAYNQQMPAQADNRQLDFTTANRLFTQKKYLKLNALAGNVDINRIDIKIRPLLYETDIHLAQQFSAVNDRVRTGQYLDRALQNMPGVAETDPRAEALKMRLANDNYQYARGVLAKDIKGSIAALELALRYNPKHAQARSLLPQAIRMQRNLEKIEQQEVSH